ncbi:MAG: type II toxin-antitoxin system VapC family toxin [Desulfobacterales bacterium]
MEDRRILIDTSVVIDHFRKKNKQRSLLYELSKENRLFLSAISKFEFLVGTKLSQIRQTEKIIEGFDILSFNSNVANVASDIAKKLKAKNKIIEFRDIFIAATAITNDMPLSTLNVKHFERIDDLELR